MRPAHYQYAIELELAAKGIEPNTTEFLGKAARGGLYINYIDRYSSRVHTTVHPLRHF